MKVKSENEIAQWCPTPSDPMDCSLPGSSVHGIFQASELEWGAIAIMSNSFETPWTVAHQAPLSMRFPRQEYWGGLPFSSPGDLPDPRTKHMSPVVLHGKWILYPLSHQGSPSFLGLTNIPLYIYIAFF